MNRPLGPFVRLPTPEEVETRARAGAVVTVKQAPHGQATTDLALRLQRRAATEREALSGDSTRAAELPRGRGVGSPAQLGPERDARAVVDKIGGDLGEPGSWTSQGRRPTAARPTDFVEEGPRSRAVAPTGRAPVTPPAAGGPEAGRAQAPLAPGGAPQRRPRAPGGVPDDGGVGRIREVVPGQGPNVDLSTGSKGGPTPHAFALEPGVLRDPRQVPTLVASPAGATEQLAQPGGTTVVDLGGGSAAGAHAAHGGRPSVPPRPGLSVPGSGRAAAQGAARAQQPTARDGAIGLPPQPSGLGSTLARQQAIKVGLHGLARTLGVAPAGTRTADLTEVNASGAAAGEAAGEPPAGADRIREVPVLSPGGDERALGRSPPAASAGTGQARGKGGGGVGALASSVVEQSHAQSETYARAAEARATYDNAQADFKANVRAIYAEPSTTPQQKHALVVASAQTHQLDRRGSELKATQSEADAASESLRESQGRLASELQKSVPGQWSDRLQEALWDASTPSAIYQRQRDAITNNRLSADAVERAGKKYAGYVARNSSTALGKHFALSEVAAQTKRDARGRGAANDALNQRQGALTERADATRNGPAEVGGKRVLPLTALERRELAKLRRDEPGRKAEDARLAKAAAKAEARRHAQVMKQGAKMATSLRKLADRMEAATASLRRKLARETDPAKFVALLRQLIVERAEIEAARKEARAIEREMATGTPPEEREEGSAGTPKPPSPQDEVVPPGCPPDYKERCCKKCGPRETCTCTGSGAGSGPQAPGVQPGPGTTVGLSVDEPNAVKPDGAGVDPGIVHEPEMRDPAEEMLLSIAGGKDGMPAADDLGPTDDDFVAAAEAWRLPELLRIALAEFAWRAAENMWKRAQEARSIDLFSAGALRPGDSLLEAFDLFQRDVALLATNGLTYEQWMKKSLPAEVLGLHQEGWAKARVRVSRAYFEKEFPGASRDRDVFGLVKGGPELFGYMLRHPGDSLVVKARAALAGDAVDRGAVQGLIARFNADQRRHARAIEEYSKPKWYETAGYVLYSPVRGFTFGLLDPADLRDDFGVGGATPEDMRRDAMSNPLLGALVLGGEFVGGSVGFAQGAAALQKLGLGVKASNIILPAVTSGLSEDARSALASGDLAAFLRSLGRGALEGAVGLKLGEYAKLLGPIEGAGARGALLGAIGGALVGAIPDPSRGTTLEAILIGAMNGAMSGSAGARGGRAVEPPGASAPATGGPSAGQLGGRLATPAGTRAADRTITVYRGMEQGEFEALKQSGVLTSKGQRYGKLADEGLAARVRHSWGPSFRRGGTSPIDTPYVSTSEISRLAGGYGKRSGEVVVKLVLNRSDVLRGLNPNQAEILVRGGSRILEHAVVPELALSFRPFGALVRSVVVTTTAVAPAGVASYLIVKKIKGEK